MQIQIAKVSAILEHIEDHLSDRLDLESVADATHYSKFHLHRIFRNTAGMTMHDYIQRRKLTEAAKRLVFSDQSVLEIALLAGYESQQAFTGIFKQLYKKSPHQFRQAAVFYPLQQRYKLHERPSKRSVHWKTDVVYAAESDIPGWMELVRLVVDGFPCLNQFGYKKQLRRAISQKKALVVKDKKIMIGAMAFSRGMGNIDFLGMHPQYNKRDIAIAFLQKIRNELLRDAPIHITTFREGDKADPGYRTLWKKLGFVEAEPLTEFGYPTQKFTLLKSAWGVDCDERHAD